MTPVIIQASNLGCEIEKRSELELCGQSSISFLISRLKDKLGAEGIVVATTENQVDDRIYETAVSLGVKSVRGDYNQVLSRLKLAADELGTESFVRVFGNYPLVDIDAISQLYDIHCADNYQYSFNEHANGVLWGCGCDVISTELLNSLVEADLKVSQQTTIGFYLRQYPDKYRVYKQEFTGTRASFKVALETAKDYEIICELTKNLDEITSKTITEYHEKHPTLAKYNLEAPPREVGLDKLYLHPDKIKSIFTGKEDMAYPISVELTLTNFCNLDCVYCSDRELRSRQGEDSAFAPEYLEKLFEDLAAGGTKGVTFEGGGEPTMYKYFDRVIMACKNAGLAAGLITNGTVKLSEDILKEFEWIRVSLDATTEAEYLDLKGVNLFERVMSNIAHYAKYCKTVGIGFVVTKTNISQIESLVMRLRTVGASYIQMRPVVDCPDLYPEGVDLTYLRFYQTRSFGVIVDGMKENAESGNHNLPCVANGITSIISGDGSVYLCGRLNIYDWLKPIGNIKEQDFKDIWEGEERRKQWEMVQDADFCSKNCPQCRVSKFNELLDKVNNIKSKSFI